MALFWQDQGMTVEEALKMGHVALRQGRIDSDAAWLEVELLLAYALKQERPWLVAHADDELPSSKERDFFRLLERRTRHEPIAYILGRKVFCGLSFEVNRHVLIPRPETEEMVDAASRITHHASRITIWDIGTGSGAIAVSVKKLFPHATVVASDVSRRALLLAEKNAVRLLGASHGIDFLQGSLLTREIQKLIISKQPKTLIVLANLPYLPLSDRHALEKDVVDFEPHQALFTTEHGNALIVKLMKQMARFLTHHPVDIQMMFEFDPPQAQTLKNMARGFFPQSMIDVHRDGCGRERFLIITSPTPQTSCHPS